MTALTSGLLSSWELYADVGLWMVVVGVAGEVVEIGIKHIEQGRFLEHRGIQFNEWSKSHALEIEFLGFVFWILVVIGLVMEWRGSHKASGIRQDEIIRLTKTLDSTTMVARDAQLRVAHLTQSNSLLQIEAAEYAVRKESSISENEEEMFMRLVKHAPKGPIRMAYHDDPLAGFVEGKERIAQPLWAMLSNAGYDMQGGWFSTNATRFMMAWNDVALIFRDTKARPPHLQALSDALAQIHLKAQITTYGADAYNVETNQILIYVFNPRSDMIYHPFGGGK